MGLFDKLKKDRQSNKQEIPKEEIRADGWDAITEAFEKVYPTQKDPKHYGTLISWRLGGDSPLQGISIYEGEDYWHFVTYGLSELYEKDHYEDEEAELKGICNILQTIAKLTFVNGEIFRPYEYIYTGQTQGIDIKMLSNITGFITIPDTDVAPISTPNGYVEFVEFIGATNNELIALKNQELTVKELYEKMGTDVTNYHRDSLIK